MRFLNKFILVVILLSVPFSAYGDPESFEHYRDNVVKKEVERAQQEANKSDFKDKVSEFMNTETKTTKYDGGYSDGHADDFIQSIGDEHHMRPFFLSAGAPSGWGWGSGERTNSNNTCIDRRYKWDILSLIPPIGDFCLAGSVPTCNYRIYPYTEYRYPVTKVETTSVGFRTRYLSKAVVNRIKNLASETENIIATATNATSLLHDIVPSSGNKAPLKEVLEKLHMPRAIPPPPRLNPEDVKTASNGVPGTDLTHRWVNSGADGYRPVEFHVVPEMNGRSNYKIINERKPVSLFYWECNMHFDDCECERKIEHDIRGLCHNNRAPHEPGDIARLDKFFLGSEFPEIKPPGGDKEIGLFFLTRNKYSIFLPRYADQLRSYRDAFKKVLGNPFVCSKLNIKDGFSPKGSISKKIEDITTDEGESICLGAGLGSLIPFWNVGFSLYETMVAQLGWYRGMALAYRFRPDIFYRYRSEDAMHWIGPRDEMPVNCRPNTPLPYTHFGVDANPDKYANSEQPDDYPLVGVHWKRFRCCLKGNRRGSWDQIR